ncbi:MAG: hypothetical protein IPG04_07910 [Polyangiaceae bacterium]|nr:hypothetical protein [Polyangiaceae bacterium]
MNPTTILQALSLLCFTACSTGASSTSSTAPASSGIATATASTASPTATAPPAPTASAPGPSSAVSSAPTASAPPSASGPVGTWSSPSCDARKYERVLSLDADGTFNAQDRVSPCPKDAMCVWSGIVVRKGTWKLDADKLTLSTTDQQKQGAPLVTSLRFDGTIVLEPSGSAKGCAYSKR